MKNKDMQRKLES